MAQPGAIPVGGLDQRHPADLHEVVGVDAAAAVAASDPVGQVEGEEHGFLAQATRLGVVVALLGLGKEPTGQLVPGRHIDGRGRDLDRRSGFREW